MEGRFFVQLVLLQAALDKRPRQTRGIDGNVEFGENVGDSADVILVTVGQHQAADLVAVLNQIADIGDDDVYPEQLTTGEHHAGVNNDDVVAAAQGEHVHTELAESTERNYV